MNDRNSKVSKMVDLLNMQPIGTLLISRGEILIKRADGNWWFHEEGWFTGKPARILTIASVALSTMETTAGRVAGGVSFS